MKAHSPFKITPSVLRELVELLYSNFFSGLLMTILAFSGLVFGFNDPLSMNTKLSLWVVMMLIALGRLADALYWQTRLQGKSYNPYPPYYRFITGTVFTMLIWIAYVVMIFPGMSTLELAATMVILSAMAGGGASVLAPSRLLVALYCASLILPMSVLAMTDSRMQVNLLGFLGVAFWAAILIISFKANRFFVNAVLIKRQNHSLVQQMETEQKETARVNDALRESNMKLDNLVGNLEVEVQRRTKDIHRLSNRDPLTSLLNRAGFSRHLESILSNSKRLSNRLAVLFIDLDGFKQVNDSLGHQVGDSVLMEVSRRLTRFCDSEHLARWGGDEFVICLPYANRDTAIAVAHAARSGITIPINIDENQITIDATIGIALFPDHADDAQALIQEADLTMYKQKRSGRGNVAVFDEEIYTALKEEQKLREGLRTAISDSALRLLYQPIINADTGKMYAVEALLRWHYEGQTVPPDLFIPLAEKTGLIHDIGIWVLHRACIDAVQLPFEEAIAVSVNVSIIQLMDDGFIRALDKVLNSTGFPAHQLHLEITESVFADNREVVIENVNAIKARNVQISIDDFGTGFSSLSQLQSLSFDHIKIDRSFVQNLEEGSDTIIRATLLIAREFGCKTIAEGIETQEHAERLTAMGVDGLQGYLYARPLPFSELVVWKNKEKR